MKNAMKDFGWGVLFASPFIVAAIITYVRTMG
jgi:hypothetical protein